MSFYLYRLIPPRPTFGPTDMNEHEAEIMDEHSHYWAELMNAGTAHVFGPVDDPAGNWGLAVAEAPSDDAMQAIRDADPAVTSGLATAEILTMPIAIVPRSGHSR